MRVARDVAILTALIALGTWLLGWWAVPLVAAAAAVIGRNRAASVAKPALAAPLAWGFLLLLQGVFGSSVTQLGRDLAMSLGLPAAVPLAMAVVLPAILAAAAAGAVVAIRRFRSQPPAPTA